MQSFSPISQLTIIFLIYFFEQFLYWKNFTHATGANNFLIFGALNQEDILCLFLKQLLPALHPNSSLRFEQECRELKIIHCSRFVIEIPRVCLCIVILIYTWCYCTCALITSLTKQKGQLLSLNCIINLVQTSVRALMFFFTFPVSFVAY